MHIQDLVQNGWRRVKEILAIFFALEKRNGQTKTLSALNIDRVISKDLKGISDFVAKFYSNLYTSNFNYNNSEKMIKLINIKIIDIEYSQICDSPLSIEEIKQALL